MFREYEKECTHFLGIDVEAGQNIIDNEQLHRIGHYRFLRPREIRCQMTGL